MDSVQREFGLDEGGFEQPLVARIADDTERSAAAERGNTRWYTRLAALATLLAATGCGAGETGASDNDDSQGGAEQSEDAEVQEKQPELQLDMNGDGRYFGLALFFGQNKRYSFRVTSTSDPQDTVEVHSNGKTADLMEGQFMNPTAGYTVEAFDEDGNPVQIVQKFDIPGTIYGPDRFM